MDVAQTGTLATGGESQPPAGPPVASDTAEVAREPLLVFCQRDYPEYWTSSLAGCVTTSCGPRSPENTTVWRASWRRWSQVWVWPC